MSSLAKHLFAASAAVLAATTAVVAAASAAEAKDITIYAAPDPDVLTRSVKHADLNLADQAGRKRLEGRVSRAVRYVCAPLESRGTNQLRSECLDFAWSGARPQMALAVERARQLAATGTSSIAPVAIAIRSVSQ